MIYLKCFVPKVQNKANIIHLKHSHVRKYLKSPRTYYLRFSTFLAWFYAIFDVKIAKNREFWPSGTLWSTRVDHMYVMWPNTYWGLVSIYLKSLPPKYDVQKYKTYHGGSKKTFFVPRPRWWNNHLHFSFIQIYREERTREIVRAFKIPCGQSAVHARDFQLDWRENGIIKVTHI